MKKLLFILFLIITGCEQPIEPEKDEYFNQNFYQKFLGINAFFKDYFSDSTSFCFVEDCYLDIRTDGIFKLKISGYTQQEDFTNFNYETSGTSELISKNYSTPDYFKVGYYEGVVKIKIGNHQPQRSCFRLVFYSNLVLSFDNFKLDLNNGAQLIIQCWYENFTEC